MTEDHGVPGSTPGGPIQNIYKNKSIRVSMAEKRGVAYTLGVLSIVFAFFSAYGLAGIVLGIIGLIQNKQDKSKKAKKLNIIGIVIGAIIFIATIVLNLYLASQTFPVY